MSTHTPKKDYLTPKNTPFSSYEFSPIFAFLTVFDNNLLFSTLIFSLKIFPIGIFQNIKQTNKQIMWRKNSFSKPTIKTA